MGKKLSPMEYKYMEFIRKFPQGVHNSLIHDEFPQAQGTKGAILFHIKEKGYISIQQKGRQTLHTLLISKLEYDKVTINMRLKDKFGSSRLGDLVAVLCGKKSLIKQQVDKLYQLIEELKEEDNDQLT